MPFVFDRAKALSRCKISYSEAATWCACQQKWYNHYASDRRIAEMNENFSFGGAVHKAIEAVLAAGSASRPPEAAKAAEGVIAEAIKRDAIIPDQSVPQVLSQATRMVVDLVADERMQGATIVANEHRLDEEIARTDGTAIRFVGFIDMLLRLAPRPRRRDAIYVVDFKTCSWGWSREKRSDPRLHAQLLLYKHFLCKRLQLDPSLVRTSYALLKKQPRAGESSVEWFDTSSGPAAVARAIDWLQTCITEIRSAERLVPSVDECVRYGGRCPYLDAGLCDSPLAATR